SYLYLEYALSTQSFELGAEREIRNIHFSTEGYNYYGDFQILIDDTVIFDMADYDYFLPATDDLCIPVEIDSEAENKISVNVGDDFIKTAQTRNLPEEGVHTFDYESGKVDYMDWFDNDVTLSSDINLVQGESKFVFRGYHGYLNIDNDCVDTSLDNWMEISNDDSIEDYKIVIFDVEASESCTITEEDITYNSQCVDIEVHTDENGECIKVDSDVILNDSNQIVYYTIVDDPNATIQYYKVAFDSSLSFNIIHLIGTYDTSYSNEKTIITFHPTYPNYKMVKFSLISESGCSADIEVYK
nr:hypothetical protein [Acholeplasmatales bacterium]